VWVWVHLHAWGAVCGREGAQVSARGGEVGYTWWVTGVTRTSRGLPTSLPLLPLLLCCCCVGMWGGRGPMCTARLQWLLVHWVARHFQHCLQVPLAQDASHSAPLLLLHQHALGVLRLRVVGGDSATRGCQTQCTAAAGATNELPLTQEAKWPHGCWLLPLGGRPTCCCYWLLAPRLLGPCSCPCEQRGQQLRQLQRTANLPGARPGAAAIPGCRGLHVAWLYLVRGVSTADLIQPAAGPPVPLAVGCAPGYTSFQLPLQSCCCCCCGWNWLLLLEVAHEGLREGEGTPPTADPLLSTQHGIAGASYC
jgi:hypothetical protein